MGGFYIRDILISSICCLNHFYWGTFVIGFLWGDSNPGFRAVAFVLSLFS